MFRNYRLGLGATLIALALGGCAAGGSGVAVSSSKAGAGNGPAAPAAAGSASGVSVGTQSTAAPPAEGQPSSLGASGSADSGPVGNTCRADQLKLLVTSIQLNETKGGVAYLVFENTSTSTCTMIGYPGVDFLDDGVALGESTTRDSGALSNPVRQITLVPGDPSRDESTSAISWSNTGSNCRTATAVQAIAPNDTSSLSAGIDDQADGLVKSFQVCSSAITVEAAVVGYAGPNN